METIGLQEVMGLIDDEDTDHPVDHERVAHYVSVGVGCTIYHILQNKGDEPLSGARP